MFRQIACLCGMMAAFGIPVQAEQRIPEEYKSGGFFIGCQAWSFNHFTVMEAIEMTARAGKDPGVLYRQLSADLGSPVYTRIDAPATPRQKAALKKLSPEAVKASTLAGEPIIAKLVRAPGNNAEIGGLKVTAQNGWFAARPSGTEDVYKIYAESFRNQAHLQKIVEEAQAIVAEALK